MSLRAFDAVVAGGGFAGLVAAAALAKEGLAVVVVEPRLRTVDHSLRGELLHPFAVRLLGELGLEVPLRSAGATPIAGFAVRGSGSATPVLLPYSDRHGLALAHDEIVGTVRRDIATRPRITIHEGRVAELVHAGGSVAGVRCADGTTFAARLVVIADGRHSKLRKLLGIEAKSSLSSHMIATTIDAEALEVAGHGNVFVGGPGPVLVYPLSGKRARVNIDVPLDAPRGREAMLAHVARHYAPHVPAHLFDAILAGFEAEPFLGAANHVIVTQACTVRGAVLIGDAGGCSHPLAATGMTCAAHDAVTLAKVIREHGTDDHALAAYQARRYAFVRARETLAQALYEVLRGADTESRALREGIFRYWEDARARHASMRILAAEESSTSAFMMEFARVVGSAAAAAFLSRSHDASGNVAEGVARIVSIGASAVRSRIARRSFARATSTRAKSTDKRLRPVRLWPWRRPLTKPAS